MAGEEVAWDAPRIGQGWIKGRKMPHEYMVKLSETRKRMAVEGWVPWNKGKK